MKLTALLTLAVFVGSSVVADNIRDIPQGAQWFSAVTSQVLANLTNDYNQFQHTVADRTAQLTKALQDAENDNAEIERQSAVTQQEIGTLQQNIFVLKGRAKQTTQENQHLRKNLQILSDKMRAAQAAAEAAVEGSDGGEAAAIAAAETQSAVTTISPAVQPVFVNQQPSSVQPLLPQQQSPLLQPILPQQQPPVLQPMLRQQQQPPAVQPMLVNEQPAAVQPAVASAVQQGGDLVEQAHDADEDDADEADDADPQQDGVVQSSAQQASPAARTVGSSNPTNSQKQAQPISQLQQPRPQLQQQQLAELQDREEDGYNVAFATDDMVDPDASYSFLESKHVTHRRNMLRRGRLSATQIRSQVVNAGGQIVALLTQGAEQYAQQEEYNVATLQNSYQGAMVLLSRKNEELLAKHNKLISKYDSLKSLHARLSSAVYKLEATRGRLQKHVAELESMFRSTPSLMATSMSR